MCSSSIFVSFFLCPFSTRLILSRNSFTSIAKWIADARKLAGADIALMLVGNKLDLEDREVSYLEASRFAQENGMHPFLVMFTGYCMGAIGACNYPLLTLSISSYKPPIRDDIFGNECADGRRRGRDVFKMWARNIDQDRNRYRTHFVKMTGDGNLHNRNARQTTLEKANPAWQLLTQQTRLFSPLLGQVDPERPGSGIQYGDSSLRRISQKSRPARQRSLCC